MKKVIVCLLALVVGNNVVKANNINPKISSVESAIKDLIKTFPREYRQGRQFLDKLNQIKKIKNNNEKDRALLKLQHKALLANPLLKKFDKILAVRRYYGKKAKTEVNPGLPNGSSYSLNVLKVTAGDDDLVLISGFNDKNLKIKIEKLYKPALKTRLSAVDLDFDAQKIMYSGRGSNNNWHLHEISANGKYLQQITPKNISYDSFDSSYLPSGKIVYTSTAAMQGLPCESGRMAMANTYIIDPTTKKIRRLTYDQDSNFCPTVTDDGKILFLRWEYCDLAHFFSRILMTMNPDGTNQRAFYGSNSYWPNTMFMAKPIPGKPSQFIASVTGHHSERPGRLVLFDTAKGLHEADGAIQFLPNNDDKVKPIITDNLYKNYAPKILSPYPLGTNSSDGAGKYYLVSCKPDRKNSLWGIYLIDTFDNIVKIVDLDNYALSEPIPFIKRVKPPVIPEQVDLNKKTANVYIANIYEGDGLKNIPRGKVKSLRLFTYHYSYYKSGSHELIGCESSWDVKRLLGVVPVYKDGSALFSVPANMPIAIQPLDENGAALQLMRSWMTAMPGENVSCIGCHEDMMSTIPNQTASIASHSKVAKITEFNGKERNYSFLREIQPILNRNCITCHDGTNNLMIDKRKRPDFKSLKMEELVYNDGLPKGANGGPFTISYNNLMQYVRRPGPESDLHLLTPMEYHSSTSPLIQILEKGHHRVTLTDDEWRGIYTWIDLNVPFWGSFGDAHTHWANTFHMKWAKAGKTRKEQLKNIAKYRKLRSKLQKLYANVDNDYEADQYSLEQAKKDLEKIATIAPKQNKLECKLAPVVENWPFKVTEKVERKIINISGEKMAFRKIPKGKFVMGSINIPNNLPKIAEISKSFWIAEKETSNKLFRLFKKDHDSKVMDLLGKDHSRAGIDANRDNLPVIRVSYQDAVNFTKWLSKKTNLKFRLPTEIEWEFAARSGSKQSFYWGDVNSDFSSFANLADKSIEKFKARQTFNYLLRSNKFNDKAQIQTVSGKYKPNNFGLYDMIGNVAEWTTGSASKTAVSCGGSWFDLPKFANVANRTPYQSYQKVFNVGIRLVIDSE